MWIAKGICGIASSILIFAFIEIPEGKEREKGPENFPNIGKEIDIQVQKVQRGPKKTNVKRCK